MNSVNHNFVKGLVRRFQGSKGTKRREICMMLAKVKRQTFWQRDEAKFLDFHDN
jgi:hypothetical protein